jgi:hypothetical protein
MSSLLCPAVPLSVVQQIKREWCLPTTTGVLTLVVVDGLARVRERKKECGNHVGLMVSLARPYLAARRNPVPYFFLRLTFAPRSLSRSFFLSPVCFERNVVLICHLAIAVYIASGGRSEHDGDSWQTVLEIFPCF